MPSGQTSSDGRGGSPRHALLGHASNSYLTSESAPATRTATSAIQAGRPCARVGPSRAAAASISEEPEQRLERAHDVGRTLSLPDGARAASRRLARTRRRERVPGALEHLEVVVLVADGDDLRRRDAEPLGDEAHALPLARPAREQFDAPGVHHLL